MHSAIKSEKSGQFHDTFKKISKLAYFLKIVKLSINMKSAIQGNRIVCLKDQNQRFLIFFQMELAE